MTTDVRRPQRAHLVAAAMLGVALVVLAGCLRAGVVSIGVLLPDLRTELGLGPATVGLLTTLPVLCFAVVGVGAGAVILRIGVHRATVLLLAAIAIGLALRAVSTSTTGFLAATTVAMAGAALGNVVLPPLAKKHFPHRVSLVSALYGAALMGGASVAAALTAPIAHAFDSWRVALGAWALLPMLGLVLWLPTVVGDRPASAPVAHASRLPLRAVASTRLGWTMAICFGAQSTQAYVQFGYWGDILAAEGVGAAHAGALLAVLTGVGIPATLLLPALIRATSGRVTLPIGLAALTIAGWTGLLVAPHVLHGWAWALLLGVGGSSFTWCLAMIGLRSRTGDGSAQLSAFTQGVGYGVAALGTFGAGILREATGGWTVPVLVLVGLAGVIGTAGAVTVRSAPLEDELGRRG